MPSEATIEDTATGHAVIATWDRHLQAEFAAHDVDAALATMNDNPRVNHVPLMSGGQGRDQLYAFYSHSFLNQLPPDMEMTPVSRTVGQGRVVDELIVRFTHTNPMTWLLPGVAPTQKRVEIALVVVAQFDGDKLVCENLYWDQATVLVQLGLIDGAKLPVLGVESTRSVLDHTLPMNPLQHRG
jgi:carboxymethylenebutenolidase